MLQPPTVTPTPIGTMGKYKLKRASDGQFMFNLHAANEQVILTSELYTQKHNAESGIASVKVNSAIDSRYSKFTSSAGQPYFTLKAANGEIIGTSEMYSSAGARDNGIASVKTNGPTSGTVDLT